jgi:hypothetical protein
MLNLNNKFELKYNHALFESTSLELWNILYSKPPRNIGAHRYERQNSGFNTDRLHFIQFISPTPVAFVSFFQHMQLNSRRCHIPFLLER